MNIAEKLPKSSVLSSINKMLYIENLTQVFVYVTRQKGLDIDIVYQI